jgi:hypothetical protein
MRQLALVCLILLRVPVISWSSEDMSHPDPCALMKDPRPFAGRVIEVSGLYARSRHDSGISFPSCQGPLLDGNRWSSTFCVLTSLATSFIEPVPFETDMESMRRFHTFFDKVRHSDSKAKVVITVVGQVQMRNSYKPARLVEGYPIGPGYCFLGRYPLVLVVKEVKGFCLASGSGFCDARRDAPKDGK